MSMYQEMMAWYQDSNSMYQEPTMSYQEPSTSFQEFHFSEHYIQDRNYQPRNDFFQSTYNEGWTQHPNFSWDHPQTQQQGNNSSFFNPNNDYCPADFDQWNEGPYEEEESGLEAMMLKFMTKMEGMVEDLANTVNTVTTAEEQNTESFIMLERYIEQNSDTLQTIHAPLQEQLPSQPEMSEECNAMSGEKEINEEEVVEEEEVGTENNHVHEHEAQFTTVQEIIQPSTIALTEKCSEILQDKLPQKLKDTGSFSIPIQIGGICFNNVLGDLGANINLISLGIFRKLGVEKIKPTNMTLQLADRSRKIPYGIVDFVVVKVGDDVDQPLILGRPFLSTSRALIEMEEDEITLMVGRENVKFNMRKERWRENDEPDGKALVKNHKGRKFTSDTKPN